MAIRTGTDGADNLVGTDGNDTLQGLGGNDQLTGGKGADILDGGSGIDTARYDDATSGVVVHLGNGVGGSSVLGKDTLVSIEGAVGSNFRDLLVGREDDFFGFRGDDSLEGLAGDDQIFGRGGDDKLFGGEGNDLLRGEADDDKLFGGNGNDFLIGDAGDDVLSGSSGTDSVSYGSAPSGVLVNLGVGISRGGEDDDTILSVEDVFGSHFDDTIIGTNGVNNLRGGDGNDVLNGALDTLQDILTGGAGADVFEAISGAGAFQRDIVMDFQHGVDKVDLSDIDASKSLAGNQAFRFVGTGAFQFEGDLRIAFDVNQGVTLVQGNTDTDVAPDIEVQLNGLLTTSSADFLL